MTAAWLGIFKKEWFKVSEFPANFIPAEAKEFTVTDEMDGTVKGFYTDSGDIHIQEIIAVSNVELRDAQKRAVPLE